MRIGPIVIKFSVERYRPRRVYGPGEFENELVEQFIRESDILNNISLGEVRR